MSFTQAASPMQKYAQINVQTGVEDASPHRIVQMLLEGALDRIAKAKGYMANNMVAEKGECISKAISIINGLRASLDMNAGEISQNLDALYEYMEQTLLSANIKNDIEKLEEVGSLLIQVKLGWDAIAEQV
jgi:flagellar protein FliS